MYTCVYADLTCARVVSINSFFLIRLYSDFNSFLVKTRFIHKEKLGVCDHEETKIIQFVNSMLGMKYRKCQT